MVLPVGLFFFKLPIDFDDKFSIISLKEDFMNEQPSEFMSGLCTFMFLVTSVYFLLTLPRKKFSDQIVIGYYDPVAAINITNNVTKNYVKKSKPEIDPEFYSECIEALISLGHKKSKAKQIANGIFEKFSPKTIQEFVSIAFKT